MTIYTAVRMKDGVHYTASNITQCTKQLKATKCTDFSKPTNYILIQKRLNSHLQFLNLDADMKRAKSDNCCSPLLSADASVTSRCCRRSLPAGFILYLKHGIVWHTCYPIKPASAWLLVLPAVCCSSSWNMNCIILPDLSRFHRDMKWHVWHILSIFLCTASSWFTSSSGSLDSTRWCNM